MNRVLFMVYDQRTAERFGGRYPIPPPGAIADHVVTGEGVEGLAAALDERARTRLPSSPAGRHRTGGTRPGLCLDPAVNRGPVQRHGRAREGR